MNKILFYFAFIGCFLTSCNNNDDDVVDPQVEVPLIEKMWISVTVSEDYLSVMLPLAGTVHCEIDWADGSSETVAASHPVHTYAQEGKYLVIISGTVTALSSVALNTSARSQITAVYNWGKTGLTYMNSAFEGCTQLTHIADDYEQNSFADIVSFNSTFAGCTGLTEIPEGLFGNCAQAVYFNNTFAGCTGLTVIPEGLFSNCAQAVYFNDTFAGCTGLTVIPERLFGNSTEAESFQSTFKDCKNIKEIPSGLFNNCVYAEDFMSTFQNCEGLTSIPKELFDNCIYIRSVILAFGGCKNVQGESPYTIVSGNKVHLYMREAENGFIAPTGYCCFTECAGLSDFASMPSDWK